MDDFLFYALHMGAMLLGTTGHIAKKIAEQRQKDITITLRSYLLRYPFQTYSMIIINIGAYGLLFATGTMNLSSALLAGIASNSVSDLAPGERSEG